MLSEFKTIPKAIYYVQTADGCTVLDPDGDTLAEITAPGGYFPGIAAADGGPGTVTFSAPVKRVVGPFEGAPVPCGAGGGAGGGAGLSASGEPVVALSGGSLTVKHATWFDNAGQAAVSVLPAAWKNEVMTCYLKSAVPVTLAGVTWLYGQPAMAAGYTFVIALQQVDAATVLANLAYTLPQ